ncbi:hypothetical protein O181_017861 [Austropuccinia psidii MF-1]|uniref:Uncharacterized protein n=1 Tax=Austropuccinia psidii MF-1 TaxID=1389203 RepID=A0A9Q3C8G0_9BASI|nr:hypothetical protein [Austropuccinia psidii MF-1]
MYLLTEDCLRGNLGNKYWEEIFSFHEHTRKGLYDQTIWTQEDLYMDNMDLLGEILIGKNMDVSLNMINKAHTGAGKCNNHGNHPLGLPYGISMLYPFYGNLAISIIFLARLAI